MNISIFYKNKFNFIEIRKVHRSMCKKDFHINFSLNILIIEEGEMEVIVNKKKFTIYSGDIFIINPFENHKCNKHSKFDIKYYVITLDYKKINLLNNSIYEDNNILLKYHNLIKDNDLFNALLSICKTTTQEKTFNIKHNYTLHILLIDIIEEYTQEITANIKDYTIIVNVLRYIYLNYKNYISIKDIARYLNTSNYEINRVFAKYYNTTIYKLIISYRMYKSKKYIYKKCNISHIAHSLGFFDQSHFHKNFKKHFELTPKDYQISYLAL